MLQHRDRMHTDPLLILLGNDSLCLVVHLQGFLRMLLKASTAFDEVFKYI